MKKIPTDKQLHFLASALLTAWLCMLGIGILYASLAVFLIGVAKEVYYDYKLSRGTPDYFDVVANLSGIVATLFVSIIGDML